MNLNRARTTFKIAKILIIGGFLLWFIETIYFLIAYGWHLKAINKYESICDSISITIEISGIILFISVFYNVVDYLLSTPEK